MKKIIIVLCLFLCLLKVDVVGETVVEYDESDPSISYDALTNTITLNNYVYNSSSSYYGISDYAIYADDDLIINLIGNNVIDGNDGIDVEGDLTIIGDGSLDINYLYIGSNSFTLNGGIINFLEGTDSYDGPMINYPAYVHYGVDKLMPTYNELDYKYYDCYGTSSIDYFTAQTNTPLANLDNIYDEQDTVYVFDPYDGNNYPLENVDGFIIYDSNIATEVEYNPDTKIYNVDFYDDFSDDGYKIHYFELAFDVSEWGKLVEYEILSATNVYEYKEDYNFVPFEVGQIYYEPKQYVGGSVRYSLTPGGLKEVGTAYFTFVCKKDNYISVKAKGIDGTYQIINLRVKDTNETKEESTPVSFIIPDTGVR